MKHRLTFLVAIALSALCGIAAAGETLRVNGAGASFPYPLYSKWFYEYHRIKPDIEFNYPSIGSGAGIKQITERTVDFGASDAPMTNDEMRKLTGEVVHIPTTLGAVVVCYNVPEIAAPLRLNGVVLAEIFLGNIRKWNDPKIAALNPDIKLPDQGIVIIARSDGSGTTFVFTEYLAKVSREWSIKVGNAKSVQWPVGLGAKGNEGVAGLLKQTPSSIGYVELGYALQNRLPMAPIQNKAGKFVEASVASVTAAAAGAAGKIPPDYRVSITDAPGDGSYPISAFTYLLAYKKQIDAAKGTALKDFLSWAIHNGQKFAPTLNYAPLPTSLVERLDKSIAGIETAPVATH
jgi:phosphate transport system substrate-binding protein